MSITVSDCQTDMGDCHAVALVRVARIYRV